MYQSEPSRAEDPYSSLSSAWAWMKADSGLLEMLWSWLRTRQKLDDWSTALEFRVGSWLPEWRPSPLSLDMEVGEEGLKRSDLERTVPSLISSHGYRVETHQDLEFWRFTIHELGTQDLTAMICRILNITGKTTLSYVGHSMGTTSFLILSSLPKYKEIVRHVEQAILLAPVVAPHAMSNFISRLAPLHRWYRWVFESMGVLEILPGTFLLERLTWDHLAPPAMTLQLRGLATTQEDYRLLDRVCLYARHSKTSFYTILHYAQNICNKKFHAYDWQDEKKNTEKYGTPDPPTYDLKNIGVPISLFWSQQDSLSSASDRAKLVEEVGAEVLREVKEVPLTHLAYLWGTNSAMADLYKDIIRLIKDTDTY